MPSKIAVVTYTIWGHIDQLTPSIVEGALSTGAQVDVFQFPELLSEDARKKMHAVDKPSFPDIQVGQLKEYDGFIFGFGTRYDRAPGSVSMFFDRTGGVWARQELAGKFGAIFTGVSSQHGGHEVTPMTTIPFFIHHGINYVPIGYSTPELNDEKDVQGGSPWGASYEVDNNGARSVTDSDKRIALHQGRQFAEYVNAFVAGRETAKKA